MEIAYQTKDAKGNDFVKQVQIKDYQLHDVDFICPICKQSHSQGCRIKDIVSSNFTDWAYVDDYICGACSRLFSLYFYNYIVDEDGIRLLNVRQLHDQLIKPQKPPFLFVITTSQKKHLFYRAHWNNSSSPFAVNLEAETIYTTPERMWQLFDFVECMQTLGCSKEAMKSGIISFEAIKRLGCWPVSWLNKELARSREIQIPLYCGQKRNISEEEAICYINSTLKA